MELGRMILRINARGNRVGGILKFASNVLEGVPDTEDFVADFCVFVRDLRERSLAVNITSSEMGECVPEELLEPSDA